MGSNQEVLQCKPKCDLSEDKKDELRKIILKFLERELGSKEPIEADIELKLIPKAVKTEAAVRMNIGVGGRCEKIRPPYHVFCSLQQNWVS